MPFVSPAALPSATPSCSAASLSSLLYLDYDTVVALNAEFGGTGAGVLSRTGIEATLGRPASGYSGVEAFPTVWGKAAALLHGFATTQYFSDGNKRTGFLVATTFLELNGYELADFAPVQSESFVLSVAAGLLELHRMAEWFEVAHEQRRRGPARDVRLEYLILSSAASVGDGDGTLSILRGNLAGMHIVGETEWPVNIDLAISARIHWREADIGLSHRFRARVVAAGEVPYESSWVNIQLPVGRGGHLHHPAGLIPSIIVLGLDPSLPKPGSYVVECQLDGISCGSVSFGLTASQPDLGFDLD